MLNPLALLLAIATVDRPPAPRAVPPARVTRRPGNIFGSVMVLMYHRIGPEEQYMVRSEKHFRADLERLYRLGYRPVTLAEYSENRMPLPRGASPVVITFDDSHPSQFKIRADGSIDPHSMIGVWQSFAKRHPDFPVKATFFVLPNGPFGQRHWAKKKLQMLKDWGCEVGSHTMHHGNLSKLTDLQVIKEFGDSYKYVQSLGFEPTSMALPFGILPTNQGLVERFDFGGVRHRYWNVCLAGSSPAPSPNSPRLNRLRIPRVQGYDGIYGINYWLNRHKKHPENVYVQP